MYRIERRCIKGLGGKSGGKEPIGRPRPRWEGKIKINFKEVVLGHIMHRLDSGYRESWRAFVNAVTKLRVP